MTKEEKNIAIEYLNDMKEKYIEGNDYERHPLPEYYAIETALKSLEQDDILDKIRAEIVEYIVKEPYTDCQKHRNDAFMLILEDIDQHRRKIGLPMSTEELDLYLRHHKDFSVEFCFTDEHDEKMGLENIRSFSNITVLEVNYHDKTIILTGDENE